MVKGQIGVVPAEVSVAYRIGIAAAIMFGWAIFKKLPLRFSLRNHLFMIMQGALIFSTNFSFSYIYSLAYLAIVASVISFAAYFALLNRISTEQATYTTVLFPVVVLTLSTFFEGYQLAISTVLGVMLIIAGNTLVLRLPLRPDQVITDQV